MDVKLIALIIFIAAYSLFIILPRRRAWVAIAGALLVLLTGTLTPAQVFQAVNWNVMGIFVGTLVLADLFIESRMPAFLAERIVQRAPNTRTAMLFICLLSGGISAFVENVATVMIIAPIALALAEKLKISPVKLLIAIAVSSNLQGAATLIGDPPSMLLAGFAKMNFMDFFFYKGRPSLFFAVELGALASLVYLAWLFRAHRQKTALPLSEKIKTWFPTVLLIALIGALALSSFFDADFSYLAGILCLVAAGIGIGLDMFYHRSPFVHRIKALDWDTTFFLVGVFVLVGSLTFTGWTETIATAMSRLIGGNLLLGYVFLIVVSVLLSAFIDNVPFLAAMLPVAILIAHKLGVEPTLFLFALLLGASIGGNITPIGASANIVTMGLLKKTGHKVSFWEFSRIGIPFTLVSVTAASLLVWFVWGR
ncbi:MAG: TRAP transporter large permease subunit [Verrucomicrobia bacterium]|nr:TRAP transporter large permease subunit [Verrucomicrobiota bacterium]MBU1736179.1 TRAP transporter large permease subunit [Verrucomicrobiota bacterium]MBU1856779.1 TRAP transporter large permease subunit [Verrucomicrobiota bacterium]